jgi:hypothetical protein
VPGEKGGVLGVLDQGGTRFLAPSNPQPSLRAAAHHLVRLHDLRAVLLASEPQFPTFPAKRGSATSPALKIGSSPEF